MTIKENNSIMQTKCLKISVFYGPIKRLLFLSEGKNLIFYYWYSKYNRHKVPTYKHSRIKFRNPESRGTMSFPQCLSVIGAYYS